MTSIVGFLELFFFLSKRFKMLGFVAFLNLFSHCYFELVSIDNESFSMYGNELKVPIIRATTNKSTDFVTFTKIHCFAQVFQIHTDFLKTVKLKNTKFVFLLYSPNDDKTDFSGITQNIFKQVLFIQTTPTGFIQQIHVSRKTLKLCSADFNSNSANLDNF